MGIYVGAVLGRSYMKLMLLCALMHMHKAALSELDHTSAGGPCSSLRDLEEEFLAASNGKAGKRQMKDARAKSYNIQDPETKNKCTWNPKEEKLCQGFDGKCEKAAWSKTQSKGRKARRAKG